MGLSFLGSSFMSELGGKAFCVAALVMLGQEVTDLCFWIFGDMCGRGAGENMGSVAVGTGKNKGIFQKLVPTELLLRELLSLCFWTLLFIRFSHSANICWVSCARSWLHSVE